MSLRDDLVHYAHATTSPVRMACWAAATPSLLLSLTLGLFAWGVLAPLRSAAPPDETPAELGARQRREGEDARTRREAGLGALGFAAVGLGLIALARRRPDRHAVVQAFDTGPGHIHRIRRQRHRARAGAPLDVITFESEGGRPIGRLVVPTIEAPALIDSLRRSLPATTFGG